MAEKGYKPPFRRIAGSPLWPYWLGLLLAFGVLYKDLEAAGRQTLEFWFNSDYLFAAHVYKDVFIDKFPFSGIKFSIAPDIFPDVVVTSVLMFLTRNAVLATFLYGLVQFTLLVWAYVLCARVIDRSRPEVSQAPILLVGIAVTLWTASVITRPYDTLYYLFLDQSHVSSTALGIICAAAGTWLCFTSLERKSARLVLAGMAVVCALAASSNLMFVPHMLLPFTCAVGTMIFLDLVPARRCCCILGIYWGGAIMGIWVGRKLVDSGALASQASLDVDRLTAALNMYLHGLGQKFAVRDLLHIFALVWLLCSFILIFWLLRRYIVSRDTFGTMREPTRRLLMLLIFLAISSVACVGSAILMGVQGLAEYKNYVWSMHYQYPLFFGSMFGLALLGGHGLMRIPPWPGTPAAKWIVKSGAVLVPLGMLLTGLGGHTSLASYTPAFVDALDSIASKYRLKYGLGGFWQAREVNLFSRRGVRLYPVVSTLEPYHWLGNKYWYAGYPGSAYPHPSYDFVVLDDPSFKLDRQVVVSRFGEPAAEEMAGEAHVMIYNRSSDQRLASMFRCTPATLQTLHAPGTYAVFSGSCLPGAVGKIEGDRRIARKGSTGRGFLSYGPYLPVEPGKYSMELHCKATSTTGMELGTWDIGFFDQMPGVTLDSGRIRPGATEIRGRFAVQPKYAARPLEVRVVYAGAGDLEIDYLHIGRDE